ncbi:unnamed protein product (macronuclear) [Paramecium tetraurelia]|uniref:B box-type domain-containing protein n=1 Tax=Paramecium tetraurelia TaxID=5888 RepID=A0CEK1_PARTE|nr:uncharacterized protein GSPATT00037656001 [Paramecium tetraurelia]CAK69218.1 unnamed protein product [Paramecium tetraurelia]|eukprot:XP_001436615.1 hypothetical protein (macronuclear) [Paramecium tetraurelia strain d4-2]
MDKEFQCCQCQLEFNLQDKSPHVLPSCGHSICQLCVKQYLQSQLQLICNEDNIECQVDRDFKFFPINQSIIVLLRKKRPVQRCHTYVTPEDAIPRISAEDVSEFSGDSQQNIQLNKSISQSHSCEILPAKENQGDLCQIHSKTLELVCQEDGEYICVNCALFGNHKFHNYKPIDIYVKEMEQTLNDITTIYEVVKDMSSKIEQKNYAKEFETKMLQSKDSKLQEIDLRFNELFNELNQIKEEFKSRIENNYNIQFDSNIRKIESEFTLLKDQADKWLSQTGHQLNYFFVEKIQNQKLKMDAKEIGNSKVNGSQLISKIQYQFSQIETCVKLIGEQQHFFVPIENIKNQFPHENKQQLDQLLLDREDKLTDSDIIYQDIKDEKLTQSMYISQQPTQPASPQYNVGKNNYFSQTLTPGQFQRKDRSVTMLQTEPSEISAPNTNRNKLSSSKFAKVQKFSKDPKLHDKIINTLAMFEKFEMIDFSTLDVTEPLIQAIDEALKNRKIVKVLKMSKCKLTDDLFAKLLTVIEESSVTALHLQSNALTEKALDCLLNIAKVKKHFECKQIYLNGNINITQAKAKKKIEEIKKYGIQVTI